MTSTAAKIRRGSLWIAGARLVVNVLSALSTIVLARLLTPDDFGVVAIGIAVTAIVSAVTEISLSQALIHHEDPDDRHINTAWTLNALRGLLIGGAMAASGPMVADVSGDKRLELVMLALGGSAVIGSLASPRLALLRRDLVFWQDFVVQTIDRLSLAVVSVVVAWLTHSYLALVAGFLASNVARVVVSFIAVPHRPRLRLKEARPLLSFSWYLTMTQIVQVVSLRMELLVMGKFLGVPTLGLYTVASTLSNIPTRETTRPLSNTLFPAFASLRGEPARLSRAYTRAQTLISAIALPSGILMAALAKPLILLTMGEKWIGAAYVVQVLAIVIATETLATAIQPLAMALSRNDLVLRRSLQGLVTRLPLILLGLSLGGLKGYLIARAVIAVSSILFNMTILRQLISIPIGRQLADNWRTLVAAIAMAAFGLWVTPWFEFGTDYFALVTQIGLVTGLAAAVYLLGLFGLWRIAGQPSGPEQEIIDTLAAALYRFRLAMSASSKN